MPTACTNGHPPTSVRMNLCLDWAAAQLLHRYCPPGQKATGRFLSRLVFEHAIGFPGTSEKFCTPERYRLCK
jgi:hypothetical protein